MNGVMGIEGDWKLAAETTALIAESRRILDDYYLTRARWSIHKPDPMVCLLCDYQASVMNRVAFKINDGSALSDGHTQALSFRFQTRFGVCDSCLRLYYGQPHRVVLELNRRFKEASSPGDGAHASSRHEL